MNIIMERRIDSYDGQTITVNNERLYEFGNFLGKEVVLCMNDSAVTCFRLSLSMHSTLNKLTSHLNISSGGGSAGIVYQAENLRTKQVCLCFINWWFRLIDDSPFFIDLVSTSL